MRKIGLENLYRLSLIVNMIDHLSGPANKMQRQLTNTVGKMEQLAGSSANLAKSGVAMAAFGREVTGAVLSPVRATFETRRAIGELSSLGIQNIQALETAGESFSNQWAGTTKADFITAAYDIKSGIASLTDEGVARYTELAGITATATKSTTDEMTSLFASGYGIYKDFYGDMSDLQFGEMFSAGISASVKQFKTTGSEMAQSIQSLGASATVANVPMEEQMAILGMLQGTMSGSEAGTKYRAFLKSVAKAGDELGISFTDANNQLLAMPEILGKLKGRFGETIDASEAMELQKAFGTDEAVAMINLLYTQTGQLENNILSVNQSMGQGINVATDMANIINQEPGEQYMVLQQQIQGLKEEIGTQLLPKVLEWMQKAKETVTNISAWVKENQNLVQILMTLFLYLGMILTVLGSFNLVVGGTGILIAKTASNSVKLWKVLTSFPTILAKIKASKAFLSLKSDLGMLKTNLMYAKDGLVQGAIAAKNFSLNLLKMAGTAIMTGIKAIPGLVASVWSFTTALLANPITWIVIGVIALGAALYLLWQNWDSVVAFVNSAWTVAVTWIVSTFEWIRTKVSELPIGFQILLAAIFPILGIPLLIINNWGSITEFFSGLWTSITTAFTTGVENVKGFLSGTMEWFRLSGERIMTTFTQGIKNMAMAPVDAVKGALTKIRQHLPFSDAKEGPLSTLTLSGKRVFTTITKGMDQTKDLPAQMTEKAFRMISLAPQEEMNFSVGNTQRPRNQEEKIDNSFKGQQNESKEETAGVIIKDLHIHLDNIKEFAEVLKFISGIKKAADGEGVVLP